MDPPIPEHAISSHQHGPVHISRHCPHDSRMSDFRPILSSNEPVHLQMRNWAERKGQTKERMVFTVPYPVPQFPLYISADMTILAKLIHLPQMRLDNKYINK